VGDRDPVDAPDQTDSGGQRISRVVRPPGSRQFKRYFLFFRVTHGQAGDQRMVMRNVRVI
jgi:hypothetical protein